MHQQFGFFEASWPGAAVPWLRATRHLGIRMMHSKRIPTNNMLACGRGRGRGRGIISPVARSRDNVVEFHAMMEVTTAEQSGIHQRTHFPVVQTSDSLLRCGKLFVVTDVSGRDLVGAITVSDCDEEKREQDHEDSSDEKSNDFKSHDGSLSTCEEATQQVKKTNKRGAIDSRWLSMYEQLKVYKEHHGDCIVPRGYSPSMRLASWVAEQRKQYQRFNGGKACSITPERIALLNELDFTWNAQEAAWDRHMNDLRRFHAEYGHCHVPHDHPNYPKLGIWVKEQRRHYSLMKQGRTCHMNENRVADLDQLGFCWDAHEATWLERLRELIEFKAQFGHCVVPTNYPENPRLGTWAHHQRRQYKLFHDCQPCHITSERIQALESLGFVWNTRCCRIATLDPATGDAQAEITNLDLRPMKRRRTCKSN